MYSLLVGLDENKNELVLGIIGMLHYNTMYSLLVGLDEYKNELVLGM